MRKKPEALCPARPSLGPAPSRPAPKRRGCRRPAPFRSVFAGAGAALVLGLAPLPAGAQVFIRVAPPSVQQQDQSSVNAMPVQSGANPAAAGTTTPDSGQREAVLSDDGQKVKMVDANGKEVTRSSSAWKTWRPNFYATLGFTYDDNIFTQRRNKSGDFVTTFAPGIVLGWGDYRAELPPLGQFADVFQIPTDELTANRYLYVDYHPTVEIFANNTQEDTVDEDVVAAGSYQFTKLTLTGRAQYQTLSDTDIDVGDRVDRTVYSGNASGLYKYDDKTSLDGTLSVFSVQFSHIYESSTTYLDQNYLNYQYAPKTNISAGFGIGYLVPKFSANQLYEQALVRAHWNASDKVYLSGVFGVEFRQSTDNADKINGIFDLAATYLPFDGTSISLTSSRTTLPSEAEFGQDIVLTNVSLQARQRLLGRFYVNGSFNYQNGDYERVSSGIGVARTDNSVNLLVGVGVDVTQYAGIQLAGRFLEDSSTVYIHSFDDEQVSLQFNVLY